MLTKKNSSLVHYNNKYISDFREKRAQVLGKSYLFFRPDNFEQHLRPTRLMYPAKCALSGRMMPPGEYAYKCHENPVRLSPSGHARVSIDEAEKRGKEILPPGCIPFHIPTMEQIADARDIVKLKTEMQKTLEKRATQMIKDGKAVQL